MVPRQDRDVGVVKVKHCTAKDRRDNVGHRCQPPQMRLEHSDEHQAGKDTLHRAKEHHELSRDSAVVRQGGCSQRDNNHQPGRDDTRQEDIGRGVDQYPAKGNQTPVTSRNVVVAIWAWAEWVGFKMCSTSCNLLEQNGDQQGGADVGVGIVSESKGEESPEL